MDYVMPHFHRPLYALGMPLVWLPDPRNPERAACLVTQMVLVGKHEVGRAELNASAGGWWLATCAHVTIYCGYFPLSLHRRSHPPTSNPKSKNPITRCELSMRASCSPCARCWDCFQTTAVLSILSFLPGQASIPPNITILSCFKSANCPLSQCDSLRKHLFAYAAQAC